MRFATLCAALICCSLPHLSAQSQQSDINSAIEKFSSSDLTVRVNAFYSIAGIPHVFDDIRAASAAVRLLLVEDQTQREIETSPVGSPIDTEVKKLGQEGWAEYYSADLTQVVIDYVERTHDPGAIHALLLEGAPPGSGAVEEFAHFGAIALPDLYAGATSPDPNLRASSVAVLGEMLIEDEKAPGSLVPPDQRARAKQAVIAGLKDPEESGAAPEAMRALAALHEPGDRELVEQAATDNPRPGHRELGRALLSRWGSGH